MCHIHFADKRYSLPCIVVEGQNVKYKMYVVVSTPVRETNWKTGMFFNVKMFV